ncbi:MAG: DNA-binding protein [Rhodobacterales bacterium]|nr:MAG: DNA-binding protein [Rhodobacterales bacterium]
MNDTVRFSTNTAPAGYGASAWNNAISETYFPLGLQFRDEQRFQGHLSKTVVGSIDLSRLTSHPVHYERRKRHIRGAEQEDYLITIPRSTPVQFRQMGKEVRCEPGGFLIERGDEPYRFFYERPNDLFVVKVAKRDMMDRLRQPDRHCAHVFDATSGPGALFVSLVEQSQKHAPSSGKGTGRVLERHLMDLLALTIEQSEQGSEDTRGSSVRAAHMVRIREYVAQNLKNPGLSPDSIAAACGISKRYLHDLFKDVNGTVSQHVRDERLNAAREQLAAMPDIAIAEIAYRFGFSDQAQFSRLFRLRFGVTPTGFRADQARN